MAAAAVHVAIEGTPCEQTYLETPYSYCFALAPAIYMALQTRNIDDGKQTTPPPSISEMERWIVASFPRHVPVNYFDIFYGITEQVYPPVGWRELSGFHPATMDQAYQVLRAGRPVVICLTLRQMDWQFLFRFFQNRHMPQDVLTRAIYTAQPESQDTRWGMPISVGTLLWTGYDPATGACTFINPTKPRSWGNNGGFKLEDIRLFTETMRVSQLRFYEFYCYPGEAVKRSISGSYVRPAQSLVPNPFAHLLPKERNKLRKKNTQGKEGRKKNTQGKEGRKKNTQGKKGGKPGKKSLFRSYMEFVEEDKQKKKKKDHCQKNCCKRCKGHKKEWWDSPFQRALWLGLL
ncbi:hypothetical protein V8F20_007366 [Naviculisporaceae sp. PSN 640]